MKNKEPIMKPMPAVDYEDVIVMKPYNRSSSLERRDAWGSYTFYEEAVQ